MKKLLGILVLGLMLYNLSIFNNVSANEKKVFYAGFSFSGNYIDKSTGIKFTNHLTNEKNENGLDIISDSLLRSMKKIQPKNFNIDYNFADLEKGLEESVVMSVILDHENFFSEYEPISKTYLNNIQMFFQVIFYNFKTRKLIASIPYDVSVPFFTKNELTEKEIINHIRNFYTKGLKSIDSQQTINAFTQVEKILNNFELKEKYKLRIGVTSVNFEEKAFFAIPNDYKKNIKPLENIFAQLFSSRLALHNDIALVPYVEGVAIGAKMKQQFVNSDIIYDIELPKPDYNINITVRGFKKVLAKKSDINNIYFWASFLNLKIYQPDLNKIYMDDNLKNVIKKSIPSQIQDVNDWYKFYITTYELFDDFSINVINPKNEWLKKANDSKNFEANIRKVNKLMEKVK
jgi:hypothetical protein|tara:strand:+ start:177 stop:1385 length:1209 start_codon:yes stop_codon:yes gene_type:complete